MVSKLFFKRIFSSKYYWLSVMAALMLLLCSVVYKDFESGEEYIFLALFYDRQVKDALENGFISSSNLLLGYDTSYLWMFIPIIAGIPSVLTKTRERFILHRTSKNKYCMSIVFTSAISSGIMIVCAYMIYMIICTMMFKENIWNILLLKKLLSVFCWGMFNSIFSIILAEFIRNKYLILCIPFAINYYINMFAGRIIPYKIWEYISPEKLQILFLNKNSQIIYGVITIIGVLFISVLLKRIVMERRLDCGV